MVYPNADVTKADQAREIVAFADWWQTITGADPQPLVFDSRLTTYPILDELGARGIAWVTLRQRGKKQLERINALPAAAWAKVRIDRARRYRRPHFHDEIIHIKGIGYPIRQIAIRNIGREQPTLLITNDLATPAKQIFARYAERMLIDNELAYLIAGFHLDALSSALALNVDLDTTLDAAANTYRIFARQLARYQRAQPERLHRDFIDTGGPSPSTTSPSRSRPRPTPPSCSTPASPTSTCPSPGGTTAGCDSPSHPDEHRPKRQPDFLTGNRG